MNHFLPLPWLLMAGAACCHSAGSILLKQSRLVAADSGFWTTLLSPWFLIALAVHSTGLLLSARALDHLPISAAAPFSTGLGFILITLLSHYLLDEQLMMNQFVALGLIFAGVVVITR